MSWMHRLWNSVRRRDLHAEIDEELDYHLEASVRDHIADGLSPTEAHAAALKRFGNPAALRDQTRDANLVVWLEAVLQDLHVAARTLRTRPAYAVAALLTLALGIGATTATFSIVEGVLLRPLPYGNAARLLIIKQQVTRPTGSPDFGVSIQEFYDYRDGLASFEELAELSRPTFIMAGAVEPESVDTGVVSSNFFRMLGVRPVLGRDFEDADDDPGAAPVMLLTDEYWRRSFAANPEVMGTVVTVNDTPHTIIGVLPPLPEPSVVQRDWPLLAYVPTSASPFRANAARQIASNRRAYPTLEVIGLLKLGTSADEARSEVATFAQRFAKDSPKFYPDELKFATRTVPLRTAMTERARPVLLMLFAVTAIILVIACANVAGLTLAHTLGRGRELATRAALGASRGRLVRQLLIESTLLAVIGGALGVVLASLILDGLTIYIARFTKRTGEIGIVAWVFWFTLAVSIGSGLIAGALSAAGMRISLLTTLRASVWDRHASRRPLLNGGLIVVQVALSSVLLVGAGLLLASLFRLTRVDEGFQRDDVLTGDFGMSGTSRYRNVDDLLRFYEPLLERLNNLPGVTAAAITNQVPLTTYRPGRLPVEIDGIAPVTNQLPVSFIYTSPRYFESLGVGMLSGRQFTEFDRRDGLPVTIVNQAMASAWNGRDPIGSRIALGTTTPRRWFTVVGVVNDVRQFDLEQAALPHLYIPLRQAPFYIYGQLIVRTAGDPLALAKPVREAARSIDPSVEVRRLRTLEDVRGEYFASPRLIATLLTVFATLALAVTLAGVGGTIARSVVSRTREFGVRMALGARRSDVLGLVARESSVPVALGLVAGLSAALALSRVLTSYLYGTAPNDPMVLAAVAIIFTVTAALACLAPAHRAVSVDPSVTLRED